MKLKLLWYCTKAKKSYDNLQQFNKKNIYFCAACKFNALNGKIVAESDFEVEEITKVRNYYDMKPEAFDNLYYTRTLDCEQLSISSCMTTEQFDNYLKDKNGYVIHIEDLHVFDKPKELSEFYSHDDSYDNMFGCFFEDRPKYIPLKKAPRSMKYVYNKDGSQRYILISAHPEGLCQILNKIKDIDVRKRVLKEMKE